MHPWVYILAALVFAVPSCCFGAETPRPEALYALNTVGAMGAGSEFGRYFDAAASRAGLAALAGPGPRWVSAAPSTAKPEPLAKPAEKPFPFVLDIPKVPPMPFERAFRRIVLNKESESYDGLISRSAAEAGLDPRLVKAIVAAESEFSPTALSPAGARGLMQVMPATAGFMGVDGSRLFDPEENVRAGTRYLVYLFQRAWDRYHLKGVPFTKAPAWLVQRVVAAYNAGPRFLQHRRLYAQTRDYVRKVLLFYRSKVADFAAK